MAIYMIFEISNLVRTELYYNFQKINLQVHVHEFEGFVLLLYRLYHTSQYRKTTSKYQLFTKLALEYLSYCFELFRVCYITFIL